MEVVEAATCLTCVDIMLEKVLAPARNCRVIVCQVRIRRRWSLPNNRNDGQKQVDVVKEVSTSNSRADYVPFVPDNERY